MILNAAKVNIAKKEPVLTQNHLNQTVRYCTVAGSTMIKLDQKKFTTFGKTSSKKIFVHHVQVLTEWDTITPLHLMTESNTGI